MRSAPEQKMVSDIHCMIAAGQDLDWIDGQGATLVRKPARLLGTEASVPKSRPVRTKCVHIWLRPRL